MVVFSAVTNNYVRPIGINVLAEAALAGLYETAHLPMPSSVRDRLRRIESSADRVLLLTQVRESLGPQEALQGNQAILASCRAMLRVLDPYCALVQGDDLRRSRGLSPNFGVGVELEENLGAGPLRIKAVMPGSPAQKAGLRGGDWITHVDGKEVKNRSSAEVQLELNGLTQVGPPALDGLPQPSGNVRLSVRRDGQSLPRTVTLERGPFQTETVLGVTRQTDNRWDFWVDRRQRIAQVRLASLAQGTSRELAQVLTSLETETSLGGLILDLRWCPGGLLNESVEVAQLFLEDGVIATVKSRNETPQVFRADQETARYRSFPIVVLTNAETSGGAELIAAALKDQGRALVAGQRSRGKANIQRMLALPVPGVDLRLTTGTFQRPNGRSLHRFPESQTTDDWGVRPDPELELRLSPDLSRQLRTWWQEQTDRPGEVHRALPLDDPSADPQRQLALQVLRKVRGQRNLLEGHQVRNQPGAK
jgi:carboxyl-terminal processing protease